MYGSNSGASNVNRRIVIIYYYEIVLNVFNITELNFKKFINKLIFWNKLTQSFKPKNIIKQIIYLPQHSNFIRKKQQQIKYFAIIHVFSFCERGNIQMQTENMYTYVCIYIYANKNKMQLTTQ